MGCILKCPAFTFLFGGHSFIRIVLWWPCVWNNTSIMAWRAIVMWSATHLCVNFWYQQSSHHQMDTGDKNANSSTAPQGLGFSLLVGWLIDTLWHKWGSEVLGLQPVGWCVSPPAAKIYIQSIRVQKLKRGASETQPGAPLLAARHPSIHRRYQFSYILLLFIWWWFDWLTLVLKLVIPYNIHLLVLDFERKFHV